LLTEKFLVRHIQPVIINLNGKHKNLEYPIKWIAVI
jgi:hypothetical protein